MMTMMISNEQQLLLVWRCLGCGVWLELCFTAANRIRRHLRTRQGQFLFDCFFAAGAGFCLFLFSLAVNCGELRGIMLLAIALGGYVSHLSFGRLLSSILSGVSAVFKGAFAVWDAWSRKIARLCKKTLKKVGFFLQKTLAQNIV